LLFNCSSSFVSSTADSEAADCEYAGLSRDASLTLIASSVPEHFSTPTSSAIRVRIKVRLKVRVRVRV